MATFPSLIPSARTLSLGDVPQVTHAAASGANVRFRYGTDRAEQTLVLEFRALLESDLRLISDHFEGQEGTLIPFALPSEVWLGYTSRPISANDYDWRYASTFSVTTSSAAPARFDVAVELISVVK